MRLMRLKTFFIINSVFSALLGSWFFVFPNHAVAEYEATTFPGALLLARTIGMLLFSFAIISWTARNDGLTTGSRGVLWAILLFHFESTLQGVYEIDKGLVRTTSLSQNIGHFSTHIFFILAPLYYLLFFKEQEKI